MTDMVEQAVQRNLVYATHDTLDQVSWMVFLECTRKEWDVYVRAFSLTYVPQCYDSSCPNFGDPDFGEGTCPQSHANPRRRMKEE